MTIINGSSLALILVLSTLVTCKCNAAGVPLADQTIFNVMDFDAKPNSELMSTQVILQILTTYESEI